MKDCIFQVFPENFTGPAGDIKAQQQKREISVF